MKDRNKLVKAFTIFLIVVFLFATFVTGFVAYFGTSSSDSTTANPTSSALTK